MKAWLALEDGTVFPGESFGVTGESSGEVVFNTGMSGYQEILTDASYKGQIVTMTYPLIGNYGVNDEDLESPQPQVSGFVVREYSAFPSNWRARDNLAGYLRRHQIMAIEGVDTRALTKRIRKVGAMKGIISTATEDPQTLVQKAQAAPGLIGRDLVCQVTTPEVYCWSARGQRLPVDLIRLLKKGPWQEIDRLCAAAAGNVTASKPPLRPISGRPFNIAVIDCGVKYNILRELSARNCRVLVLPASTSATKVLRLNPDGILVSNGPGDPEGVPYVVENIRALLGEKPIFGICLGHQLLGLALGGSTYKLKFGHHGTNHPVKQLHTGRVEITSQNHGFCVQPDTLDPDLVEITHINLNDQTLEGIVHRRYPAFSVQYHPEAAPGPHDANYLFDRFIQQMERSKNNCKY